MYTESYIIGSKGTQYAKTAVTVYPDTDSPENSHSTDQHFFFTSGRVVEWFTDYYIKNVDGSYIVNSGGEVTIKLQRMYDSVTVSGSQGSQLIYVHNSASSCGVTVYYADGTVGYGTAKITKRNDGTYDIEGKFTPGKDVLNICLTVKTTLPYNSLIQVANLSSDGTYYTGFATTLIGELTDMNSHMLNLDQSTKTEGLLGSIFDGITNGFNDMIGGITSGFTEMGNKLSGLLDSILELPSKIWSFIENGLKSLFVPDEEYIVGYKTKWENLLSDKLGAVYQVAQVTFGAWGDVSASDETNTINFPEINIPLPDNNTFSFGGYEVQIVPDGFTFIVDVLKTIVGVACTLLFVNGLRKRYDEIMGVET